MFSADQKERNFINLNKFTMKKETSKLPQTEALNIACVSGSKSERISKMKELFEQGRIYFDKEHQEKTKDLIISCDFGGGKDYSRKHIFYYR
jgi:pyridoxine/pyridoxamine 5'-phosphate oxidase